MKLIGRIFGNGITREPNAGSSHHYLALDGLRGLAVLFVMLHHFVRSYDSESSVHIFLLHSTEFMWSGVDLFFVLSGFLITGILLDSANSPHYFRNFYVRRVLRIFPLYYGVLFLAFIVLPLFNIRTSNATQQDVLYLLTFTSNIKFALSGWTYHAFDVYWSLAVEEQFYLIWPLLLFWVPPRYYVQLTLCGVFGGLLFRYLGVHLGTSSGFLYAMLPGHADGLFVGAATAMIINKSEKFPSIGFWPSIILSLIIALFLITGSFRLAGITLYYDAWNTRGALFYYPILAIMYGVVLYLCISAPNPVRSFFKNSQLRMFGKYSYCLYLIHQPIAHLFHWSTKGTILESDIASFHPVIQEIIQSGILLLVSLGCAVISWRFLELPMLRLKRYLPYTNDGKSEILKPAISFSR